MLIRKKNKKMTDDQIDKATIRFIRQQIYTADQMKALNIITEEEYNDILSRVVLQLGTLEQKYGLR